MNFFLALVLLTSSSLSFSQVKKPMLIPYRKGDLWGYCDRNKKIKIPVKFEEATLFGYSSNCCFYEDYAKVKLNGEYYVVDRKGKLKKESTFLDEDKNENSPPQIDEMLAFFDTYEKDGSVTTNGKVIIPANKYKNITVLDGYNPFFIVSDSNYLQGIIDRNQKVILPLKYHSIFYFFLDEYYDSTLQKRISPAYFVFKHPKDKKLTIAKYKDSIVKLTTVYYCGKLNNFIAFGEPDPKRSYDNIFGLLNRNLEILVKPKYAEIVKEEENDIFLVRLYNYDEKGHRQEDKFGYIDKKGTEFFE